MDELTNLLSFAWQGTNDSPGVRPHVLPVDGFEDYLIRGDGVVFTMKSGKTRELKPWLSTHGYHFVSLSTKGVKKNKAVHRLVATHFIPNTANKPDVNHIDGVKTNNRAENLEWVTKSENLLHSHRVLGQKNTSKAVRCVETGVVYKSAREAERLLGINNANICSALKGRSRHPRAGGYHWEYV